MSRYYLCLTLSCSNWFLIFLAFVFFIFFWNFDVFWKYLNTTCTSCWEHSLKIIYPIQQLSLVHWALYRSVCAKGSYWLILSLVRQGLMWCPVISGWNKPYLAHTHIWHIHTHNYKIACLQPVQQLLLPWQQSIYNAHRWAVL